MCCTIKARAVLEWHEEAIFQWQEKRRLLEDLPYWSEFYNEEYGHLNYL